MDVLPGGSASRPPWPLREWLEVQAARSAFHRFLVMAIPTGVLFGVFTGVRDLSVAAGVGSGVMFGVLFGATMTAWVGPRLRELRSLSPSQRAEVITAVRRGGAVADARLASAVIAYAGVVRRSQMQPHAVRRLNMVLVACGVITVLTALPRHRPSELLIDGLILALLVRAAMKSSQRRSLVLVNAGAAERAARSLASDGQPGSQ